MNESLKSFLGYIEFIFIISLNSVSSASSEKEKCHCHPQKCSTQASKLCLSLVEEGLFEARSANCLPSSSEGSSWKLLVQEYLQKNLLKIIFLTIVLQNSRLSSSEIFYNDYLPREVLRLSPRHVL